MPNVTVIAIGIGHAVDLNELKAIATDQQHVFTVSNFDLLPTLQKELEDKTCTSMYIYIISPCVCFIICPYISILLHDGFAFFCESIYLVSNFRGPKKK